MSADHSKNGHHKHEYWYKERHAGLKDEKPVRIPPPMCPELLKNVNNCIKEKGAQYPCMDLIKKFNDCEWRMNFQHEM